MCVLALGHVPHEHHGTLLDELTPLSEECSRPGKQRRGWGRPDDARKALANIMRILADTTPPGHLSSSAGSHLRGRLLEWMRDTALHLRGMPPLGEVFWEHAQVRWPLQIQSQRLMFGLYGFRPPCRCTRYSSTPAPCLKV